MTGRLGNHRKALAVLGADDPTIPSISRNPPTGSLSPHQIAPWALSSPPPTGSGSQMSDDQSDYQNHLQQGRSGSRLGDNMDGERDTRRPSVASIMTMSSQGSRSSAGGRYHKKLQGFFGDDYDRFDTSRQGSDASLPGGTATATGSRNNSKQRDRGNSISTNATSSLPLERPPSPSRPQTPSSEVTPWMFQNLSVSSRPTLAPLVRDR